MTLPAMLGLLVFFVIPVLSLLGYSFMTAGRFSVHLPLTLENFRAALTSSASLRLAGNSLIVGGAVATLCVLIGLPVAAYIRYRAGRWEYPVLLLFVIAMFASYLVRIYAWRLMLGAHGAVNATLLALGVIDTPLKALLFSKLAIVLAMVHIGIPWVVLILYSAMRPLEPRYLEAAQDLGATAAQRWWKVMFPLLAAPIGSAFLLIFILASSDYVAPQFLGSPSDQLIGIQIQSDFRGLGNWGFGAARSFLTLLVYVFAFGLLTAVLRFKCFKEIHWEN